MDPLEADALRLDLVKQGDYAGLLDLLHDVRFVLTELKTLERDVEDDAARLMPHKLAQTARVVAERRVGNDRKQWQHEDLAKEVIRAGINRIDHPIDVATLILGCAGISYWRVTRLRELGINVDDFCETTPGRASIQLRERDHA